jgi:hypothetical protein
MYTYIYEYITLKVVFSTLYIDYIYDIRHYTGYNLVEGLGGKIKWVNSMD